MIPEVRGVIDRIAKLENSNMASGAKATTVPSPVTPTRRPSLVTRYSRLVTAGTLEVT